MWKTLRSLFKVRQVLSTVDDAKGQKLIERDDELNKILCAMLQGLFLAMSELLNRMLADHLPEGIFLFLSEE